MNQEFDLVYYGNFNYEAVEEMPQMERRYMYERLAKQKEKEAEKYNNANTGNTDNDNDISHDNPYPRRGGNNND